MMKGCDTEANDTEQMLRLLDVWMINEARPFFQTDPVQMIVPGLCIVVTLILINLAGDALHDYLDPRFEGAIVTVSSSTIRVSSPG